MKELKSSVQKTFAILEYFTVQKPEWGVTELAEAIGSNKSTVYRFLSDMGKLGILYKDPSTEKYSLGLKLFELGNRVHLQTAFVDNTHPELIKVAGSITETVHIAVLKNHQVFYVDKVESPQGLKISSHIGSYNPAYATSLGKMLLAFQEEDLQKQSIKAIMNGKGPIAFTQNTITRQDLLLKELKQIRRNGFAIDREEFEIGLICVAVPIFNQKNEVVASLSASGPSNRFEEEKVSDYVATLKNGADAIRNRIGYFKP
ncbi:MAG: IclR family transcriptional regulator [Bacteroidia bacterium]|nr:IclR family transcriptional regulator [Bacteroidia bacterium]